MTDNTEHLFKLIDYDYQIWEYTPVHSALTLLATKNEKPNETIYLLFGQVAYMEMPMLWHGNFTLASDEEYISIERKSIIGKSTRVYPLTNRRKIIELYKVKRSIGNIYLFGNIVSIKSEMKDILQKK